MVQLLGEYDVRMDDKGRLLFPAGLRKQLPPESQERFVLNRGFESCLALYPFTEWQKITAEVNALNPYVQKNREFIRFFHRGAMELVLDGSGRLLIPKRLQEWAGIGKDVVLSAIANRIEIWSKEKFDTLLTSEPNEFASLAEEVMGTRKQGGE
jgi:MraZ protein